MSAYSPLRVFVVWVMQTRRWQLDAEDGEHVEAERWEGMKMPGEQWGRNSSLKWMMVLDPDQGGSYKSRARAAVWSRALQELEH